MVSPPKPWERNSQQPISSAASTSGATVGSSSINYGPRERDDIPVRPPAMTSNPTTAQTNPYNSLSSYSNPYSSYGTGYGGYGSGYNRFGSGYSPFGGYGGGLYGGGMGYGMNSMGYGMGGMGYGMGTLGMPMDPNNPSLTQTLESTTQQTFALIHNIVQTFTGLSQMLESTFMATHSSFFAMVGVVDQFSHLRNALGSVLGLFGLLRWLKEVVTGKRSGGEMQNEFRDFVNGRPVQRASGPPAPKPSKKPLIIFLLAIFGVPYAMHMLIKVLSARASSQQRLLGAPFDPSTLTFARSKYVFSAATPAELSLKENEIVAIMGKLDPNTGNEVDPRTDIETDWWKGRTRDGREGWFPSKWVEILERKKEVETKA